MSTGETAAMDTGDAGGGTETPPKPTHAHTPPTSPSLSTHGSAVENGLNSNVVVDHGVAVDRNGRFRRTMEDVHVVEAKLNADPNTALYCVFDGHGGKAAADFAGVEVPKLIIQELGKDSSEEIQPQEFYEKVIASAYAETDNMMKEQSILYAGCTAVSCLIVKKKEARFLYTANAGDARAVLWRSGTAIRLSKDHKGTDESEETRIRDAGGFVSSGRVNGILAVTRSLGDILMKEFVINTPFFTAEQLTNEDKFIIVACDGLWDVIEDEAACKMIASIERAQDAAQVLVDNALALGSTDNITVVVIHLQKIEGGGPPPSPMELGIDKVEAIPLPAPPTAGQSESADNHHAACNAGHGHDHVGGHEPAEHVA